MDTIDTVARLSQLLLSRRISANLVLSVFFATAIGAFGHHFRPTLIAELRALGATPCTLILFALLAFAYGSANLMVASVIDIRRGVLTRRRVVEEKRRADAEYEQEREQQEISRKQRVSRLCNLIDHLTEEQQQLLKVLNDDVLEQEIAWEQYDFYARFSHLLSVGFLSMVESDLPEGKALYRLTSGGAEAIRVYRQQWSERNPESPRLETAAQDG